MQEPVTTQERYCSSISSSNLRVQGENVRGDADLLIAAGWCKSKFGAALMRLRAEWDGSERWGVKFPVRPTKRAIAAEARELFKNGERTIPAESMKAARLVLEARYESEMRRSLSALKSLPEVARMLEIKMRLECADTEQAPALLLYWLDPHCKACHGTGMLHGSNKTCGKCRGHCGFAPVPGGEKNKEVIEFLSDCASRAGFEAHQYCRH